MKFTPYPLANLLLLGSISVILGHTFYLYRQKRLLFFDPIFMFWGGYFICYILQPVSFSEIFVDWHSVDVLNQTLFYSLIGVICVVWGYEMDLGVRLGQRLPQFTRKLDPDKFVRMGLILVGLGLVSYYFLFQSAGGMWEWLSYGRGGTDYDKVGGYVRELEKLTPVGTYLLLIHVCIHPVSRVKKTLVWIFMALVWTWYLYLGTRSRVIGVLLLAGSAYYVPRRKNPSLLIIVPAFLGLFILTNFQAHYRDSFSNLSFNLDQIDMEEAKALTLPGFLGGDKEMQHHEVSPGIDFNVAMATVELVPKKVPYNYGWGFLEFVTRIIPKSIWPNKIYPGLESWQGVLREGGLATSVVADRDLVMGPAFTFVAFWYYILGPISMVLGGLYTGILFRTLRTILDRDLHSEGNLVIYNTMLVIGFTEAASTPFEWVFDFPVSIVLPLSFLLYFCRQESPQPLASLTRPLKS
jgi:hypothetical protein